MKRSIIKIVMCIIFIMSIIHSNLLYAEDYQLLYEQGIEAFKSQNYGSAELLFRKIIDADDANKDNAWYFLALSIFHQKKYKAAIFEFNRYLLISNSSELKNKTMYWIAESHYLKGDKDKALEEFKRFITENKIKKNPLMKNSLERIGDIYYNENRFDEAIIEWKKAQKLSRKKRQKIDLNLKISIALFLNKNYSEAKKYLGPLTRSKKDSNISSKAILYLGRIYQLENKHKISLNLFDRIPNKLLSKYPFYNIKYYKGLSALQLNNEASAKANFELFLLVGKKSEWFYHAKFELGKIIIKSNYRKGLLSYNEVLRNTNNKELKIKVSLELGKLYLKQNKYKISINFLKNALINNKDKKEKKEILFLLADAYLNTSNYSNAENILLNMISEYQFDKELDRMYFLLATVYLRKGNTEKAADTYKKINEINPFSDYLKESNYYLGLYEFDQNKYVKSEKLLKKYLSQVNVKMKYEAHIILLKIYIKLNKRRNVFKITNLILNKFSKKNNVGDILYEFINYLYEQKINSLKYEKLIIRKYPKSDSTALIYKLRGNKFFAQKKYKSAELYYTKYMKIKGNEHDPEIFIKKAQCFYNSKRYKKVIHYLTTEKFTRYDKDILKSIIVYISKSHYNLKEYKNAYQYMKNIDIDEYTENEKYIYFELALNIKDISKAKLISKKLDAENKIKSLYSLGIYYKELEDYEISKEYFQEVLSYEKESIVKGQALLELAKYDIMEEKFNNALEKIELIKNNKLKYKKRTILATIYFGLNKESEAINLVKSNLLKMIKYAEAENLLKLVIKYYYKKNSLKNITFYGKYLKNNFTGNSQYANYYTANYFYNNKSFKNSYYYYYKVSQKANLYKAEVLYKLAILSLYVNKNKKNSIRYYKQLLKTDDKNSEYYQKGRINLAILLNETGNTKESEIILKNIIEEKNNINHVIQAENLYEYFDYKYAEK